MQRYFISSNTIHDNVIDLSGSDFHHIKNVMRFQKGDFAEFVSEQKIFYLGKLIEMQKDIALFQVVEKKELQSTLAHITIAQALIKRDRFELFLEKTTELGIDTIIPTSFERSIIRISEKEEDKKLARYRSITKEASEQSKRTYMPQICPISSISDIDFSKYDHVLVCYEKEETNHSLKQVIRNINKEERILVFIGPEGGISPKEIEYFVKKRAVFISLGSQILRSETAALFVLAAFLYEWEI